MGSDELAPSQEIALPEGHEDADKRPGLHIIWDGEPSVEVTERYPFDAARVRAAMGLVGIDEEEIDNTLVVLGDSIPVPSKDTGLLWSGAVLREGFILSDDENNNQTYFRRVLALNVRNPDGSLWSADQVDRSLYHELTHIQQLATGRYKPSQFDYNNPRHVKIGTRVARAGLVAGSAANLGAEIGIAVRPDSLPGLMIEHLPHAQIIALIGMGVAAVAGTVTSIGLNRNMPQRVATLFHRMDINETEARSNEKLARELPVFAASREDTLQSN